MSESDEKAHLSPVSGGKRLSSGFKASPEGRRRSSAGGEKASSSGRPPRPSSGDSRPLDGFLRSRTSWSSRDLLGGQRQSSGIASSSVDRRLSSGDESIDENSAASPKIPHLSIPSRVERPAENPAYLRSPFQQQGVQLTGLRGTDLDAVANAVSTSRSVNMDSHISPEKMIRKTWTWLAEQPEDAAELAQLLFEATPRLGVSASQSSSPRRSMTTRFSKRSVPGASLSLLDRLKAAEPMATGAGDFPWEELTTVCPTELLGYEELTADAFANLQVGSPQDRRASSCGEKSPSPRGDLVEINSGGQVFFCFFSPKRRSRFAAERVLVLKFHPSRLATQSEQFANELARHLGICSPHCRILRQQGPTAPEWCQLKTAAAALGAAGSDLQEQLSRCSSCLVMEFISGLPLFKAQEPFQDAVLPRTASDLGRLFILDMLLGNPDRLACQALNWRGNPENLRYCTKGVHRDRLVAIDAVVQRRPPGGFVTKEEAHCNELAELALNDIGYASQVLQELLVDASLPSPISKDHPACLSFQASLGNGLKAMMRVKGLLEMMFEVLSVSIGEFIEDIEGVEAAEGIGSSTSSAPSQAGNLGSPSSSHTSPRNYDRAHAVSGNRWGTVSPAMQDTDTSRKIKSINREARQNQLISQRLDVWKAKMKKQGEELRTAVEDWQVKHSHPDFSTKLTTGFLDGVHPIVDAYELKVRLEHMLQRLRALQDASLTGRPIQLLPHLYVSGAVEANSLHILRHLGISRILNATEDLLLPEESAGFRCLRCPIRDEEEVDISTHFEAAEKFIEAAERDGEIVLVHCHEGKSRSVSLILAYLMQSQKWTLKRALEFVKQVRPQASPNTGFMAHLLRLDQRLHGKKTVALSVHCRNYPKHLRERALQGKRTKPEPRVCPVCSEKVGVSSQSLALHVKKHHPEEAHRSSLTGEEEP